MRLSVIFNEYKKTWLISSLGVVLYVVGVWVLSVNEGRTFTYNRALSEALVDCVSIKNENFYSTDDKSLDYEGKLIHLKGELRVQEPLADATYNIMTSSVKLKKIVQMYQWHEDYTENKFGEPDETARNYFYFKDWSENVMDSRSFHSLGHQNPRQLPMKSKLMINEKAFIGNFEIGDAAKEFFSDWIDVTSDTKPEDPYIKMHSGWYYHVEDLFEPLVGDVRVKFQLAGLEGIGHTIVGQLLNGIVQPYESKYGTKKILLISKGEKSIDDIFRDKHVAVQKKTWMVRLFGFAMLYFAVLSTESLLRLVLPVRLPYISLEPNRTGTLLKITALVTIATCVVRQLLHYLRIF